MASDLSALAEWLKIPPTAVSKRLCFVKGSNLDDLWHICDFNYLHEQNGMLYIMPLHSEGELMPKAVVADSLSAVALQTPQTIKLCSVCVDEFRECFDDIQKEYTTRFVEFDKVLKESRSDDQIGGAIEVPTREKPPAQPKTYSILRKPTGN